MIQMDKFKFQVLLRNRTRKVYECRIAVVVSCQCSPCWVLKVSVVGSLRLSSLLVCGDSVSRRWKWSLCLVQIVGVAVWPGCRRCWRLSMMWTHWLQRLDDQCLGLFNPWLTGCVRRRRLEEFMLVRAMWPLMDLALQILVAQERLLAYAWAGPQLVL